MKLTPEPDQIAMHRHLMSGRRRALFCGMGRGKTAAALMAAVDRIIDTAGSVLVVAPLNVILLTWPAEIRLWDQFKWLRVANLRTREGLLAWYAGSADIYLINWDYIPTFIHKVLSYVKKGENLPVNTVIYDELSKAKNHASKRVNQWRRFTYLFNYHIGLTGTPNPNSYLDLFAQFRLLCGTGSPLGTAFGKFREKYFVTTDWQHYKWEMKPGAKEEIEALIAPYVLSLGAGDFPMETIDHEVELPAPAMKFYRILEKDLLAQIRNEHVTAVNAAVLVQKLLQATSGCVYNEERKLVAIHGEKIKAIRAIRKENPRQTMLLVTMFKHERSRLLEAFPEAELFSNDPAALARWNAGKIPLWIIDPRSAGHGLNMQMGGHIAVWMSLTYSREYYDQTNARLARKGQAHTVKTYRLICPLTVDNAVSAVLEHKGNQQSGLFESLTNLQLIHEN